jgi:hypothetical protein
MLQFEIRVVVHKASAEKHDRQFDYTEEVAKKLQTELEAAVSLYEATITKQPDKAMNGVYQFHIAGIHQVE